MEFDLNVEPPLEHARGIFLRLSFCRPFILELDEHGALVGFFDLNITSFSIGFDLNLELEDAALDDVIDSTIQHEEEAPIQGIHACSFTKLGFDLNVHAFVSN
jgi:hypothetical protein